MLEEAVSHLLQRQPHVLEADLLTDDVKRHVRKAVVHGAHGAHQHAAVADAGVEHAHGRRTGMQERELAGDPTCHLPFLAAGVDEQQIFLPVVEEAEVALRIAGLALRHDRRQRRRIGKPWLDPRLADALDDDGTRPLRWVGSHEVVDAVEGVGGDATATSQPRGELAVIDGAAPESRFRQPCLPAIVRDFLKEFLGVHRTPLLCFLRSVPSAPGSPARAMQNRKFLAFREPGRRTIVNHKLAHDVSGHNSGEWPNCNIQQCLSRAPPLPLAKETSNWVR